MAPIINSINAGHLCLSKMLASIPALIRKSRRRELLPGPDDLSGNNPLGETFDLYFLGLNTGRDDPRQWDEYGRKGPVE